MVYGKAKAKSCSRSESKYESANKSYTIDPKPGDLIMARVKAI